MIKYKLSGTIHEGEFVSQKFYKNAVFAYKVHIPECCNGNDECGLIVTHDGLNKAEAYAAEFLQKSGKAPKCVTVGISPGKLQASSGDGYNRGLRFNTYDISSGRYADMIVDELIPYLTKKYNLSISKSADMHLVSGGSSGGILAWNCAWHRNDYFHRVYASSPTFSAMGNGEQDPFLIRKFETKPIRVFTDYSENEPDEYFGNSVVAGMNFESALKFAKYDYRCEYHPGEGHVSRLYNYEYAIFRMMYLWENWDTEPIKVKGLSERVADVTDTDSVWKKEKHNFENHKTITTQKGTYEAVGNKVIFSTEKGESVLTDEFEEISAIALSSDKWRMYIGDKKRRCIYAATIDENGSFDGIYTLGVLHVPTEFKNPGAYDICVDEDDRVYASTELGIQCIRSFGTTDVILSNPDKAVAENIELDETGKMNARTSDEEYSRQLKSARAEQGKITQPKHTDYYD